MNHKDLREEERDGRNAVEGRGEPQSVRRWELSGPFDGLNANEGCKLQSSERSVSRTRRRSLVLQCYQQRNKLNPVGKELVKKENLPPSRNLLRERESDKRAKTLP